MKSKLRKKLEENFDQLRIRDEDGTDGGILVFQVDQHNSNDLRKKVVIIEFLNPDIDTNQVRGICKHLGKGGRSVCDFLHVKDNESDSSIYVFLIELTDLFQKFEDRLEAKITGKTIKQVAAARYNRDVLKSATRSSGEERELIKKLLELSASVLGELVDSSVEEYLKKYLGTLDIMYKLHAVKEFQGCFELKQSYQFVLLDVPHNDEEDVQSGEGREFGLAIFRGRLISDHYGRYRGRIESCIKKSIQKDRPRYSDKFVIQDEAVVVTGYAGLKDHLQEN